LIITLPFPINATLILRLTEISDQDIAAQAFLFFFAGYETVSTLLAFAAHELAENPDIQERLREEIDQAINNDGLSYDSVMGMKYLEMVVSGNFANFSFNLVSRTLNYCELSY
jgi:Cytochrome P450